jgi:hypothetical protein
MTSVNRLHTLLWEQMKKLPDGHRIFQATSQVYIGSLPAELVNDPRDLWALADNSGTYPHDTEDGVMWLDYRRPLTAGLSATEQNEGLFPSIPLVTKDGKPVGTAGVWLPGIRPGLGQPDRRPLPLRQHLRVR